jgi:hypothetical protein
MRFELKCLHLNGVALTLEEQKNAPFYTGNLMFEDLHPGIKDGRFFCARLVSGHPSYGTILDVIPPLFDGHIETSKGILTLCGYQIHADIMTGIRRYSQEWALRRID